MTIAHSNRVVLNKRPDELMWDDLPNLDERHRAELIASSISPAVAKDRDYRTVTDKQDVMSVGFKERQAQVPGWMAKSFGIGDILQDHVFKPDSPRTSAGKLVKYEQPTGHAPTLDVPRRARPS